MSSTLYSRPQFEKFCAAMARTYNVKTVAEMFSIDIPKALKLINAIQESAEFLNLVNMVGTTDKAGRVVELSANTPIASTTDTSGAGERSPKRVTSKEERNYLCQQVNFDWGIGYEELDQWRRFSDYNARVQSMILTRIALDLLLIGFYGTSHAATSDPVANPLLQDVHPGWLFDLKTNKPANYIGPVGEATQILIGGDGAAYANIDQAAYDMLTLIPKAKRNGREMVIIGQNLLSHEAEVLYELYGRKPTEKQAMQALSKGFGGMKAVVPAGFPDNGLMVCDPSQLLIYVQDSSIRKMIVDNPKKDQIEHYQSQNLDYKIADLDCVVALDYTKVALGD
ncbi:MAG: P2 family phage major capsid protein [Victivallaceae bacterium]